jgi:organic hydroperoxide reductase OsmC/OhrA
MSAPADATWSLVMERSAARYSATATGGPQGPVPVSTDQRPTIETGRQADNARWSPEELLMAAVADSFVLTFRDIAAADGLDWRHLTCRAEAVRDGAGGDAALGALRLAAEVIVPAESGRAQAVACLDRAERQCPVIAALNTRVQLHPQATVSAD